MPCNHAGHVHRWVIQGELVIERCEKTCGFCHKGPFKSGWFIRRHVRDVHIEKDIKYQNLTVSEGWSGKPKGNARPHSDESITNRRKRKLEFRQQNNNHTEDDESVTVDDVTPHNTPGSISHYAPAPFESVDLEHVNVDLSNDPSDGFEETASAVVASPPMLSVGTGVPGVAILSLDPGVLVGNGNYRKATSPWSIQQTARLTGEKIKGERPLFPIDTGADTLRTNLNDVFAKVRAESIMTDEELLGTAESFLKAFAAGTVMSPFSPLDPASRPF